MENITHVHHNDMTVALRKDFYSLFDKELKEFCEKSNCILFSHNIIKNYHQKGHAISSFSNHEKWQELYWNKYCNDDPIEKSCHQNALKTTIGFTSWNIADQMSECADHRKSIVKVKDGLLLAYHYPNNMIENISLGWEKLDIASLDLAKIIKIGKLLMPLRQYHIKNSFVE